MRQVFFWMAIHGTRADRGDVDGQMIFALIVIILAAIGMWLMIRASHRHAEIECRALLEKIRAHLLTAPDRGVPIIKAARLSIRYSELSACAEQHPEWEMLLLDIKKLLTDVETALDSAAPPQDEEAT